MKMFKKLLLIFTMTMLTLSMFAQGDCPTSAETIDKCDFTYTGNNGAFGSCSGDKCGCVGGGTNPSNIDNDCSTECGTCNCGSDFLGSIENSMFWAFEPVESCQYSICITARNCCCGQGPGPYFMQIAVWQRDLTTNLITEYHVNENSNTNITGGNTFCYGVDVIQSSGEVLIMADGNAGSECDVDVVISAGNDCSASCPIIVPLPVFWFKVSGKKIGYKNNITWNAIERNVNTYIVERSSDGVDFEEIGYVQPQDGVVTNYQYMDNIPIDGVNYYRIVETLNDVKSYSKVVSVYNSKDELKVIREFDMMLNPIDSTYNGLRIQQLEDGSHRKIIQTDR